MGRHRMPVMRRGGLRDPELLWRRRSLRGMYQHWTVGCEQNREQARSTDLQASKGEVDNSGHDAELWVF